MTATPTVVSGTELRTHQIGSYNWNTHEWETKPETYLRGGPIGEQVQVWECDRLIEPSRSIKVRYGKRRIRQHITIMYCAEGWHSDSGTQNEPFGPALCSTVLEPQWRTPMGGFDRGKFSAWHETYPVVWVIKISEGNWQETRRFCDPEMPDEFRPILEGKAR